MRKWMGGGFGRLHGFPLLQLGETGELVLREGRLISETSHAGMIRIGFEGIFSAPLPGAPLFQ
jgi:hypothetical protein